MTEQYVKELLASTDIDDITLGVIIGAQNDIMKDIMERTSDKDTWYQRDWDIHKFRRGHNRIVVCKENVYYICCNAFIGQVRERDRIEFVRLVCDKTVDHIWNDESIPEINEIISQFQQLKHS